MIACMLAWIGPNQRVTSLVSHRSTLFATFMRINLKIVTGLLIFCHFCCC